MFLLSILSMELRQTYELVIDINSVVRYLSLHEIVDILIKG